MRATALPSGYDTLESVSVPELSYFFPAHDEEANVGGLVAEALEALPGLAERFEILIVDDGSRDATGQIAERLANEHPGVVRVVHHATNLGYGAALRSGFAASRYGLVAFTDGDRQFHVAELARVLARAAGPDAPDVVAGYRLRRADPALRIVYARLYRFSLGVWYGLWLRDVDCACKLFRRPALEDIRLESDGAFLSAELLIKLRAAGRSIVEVGVPHYPRTAGAATGARPVVVLRAVREFWRLRLLLWLAPRRAMARGRPVLGQG